MTDGLQTTAAAEVQHIITIFADTIKEYPLLEMDIFQYCQTFDRTGQAGNTQEIVYVNFSAGLASEVAEGAEPKLTHQDLLSKTMTVKKFAERPAVTAEMIEDSRFDEMKLALTASGQKMVNRYAADFFTALKATPYGSTDVPEAFMNKTWANAAAHLYSADHAGTLVAQSQAGHIYNTGSATLYTGDLTLAQRHCEEHGFTPDTLLISEALHQKVRDLAGFTKDITNNPITPDMAKLGRIQGQLMGMDVVVVKGGWLADNQFIVMSKAAKPVAYLNKRALRVDDHTLAGATVGWDIKAVTLSARFGFSGIFAGAVVLVTVST